MTRAVRLSAAQDDFFNLVPAKRRHLAEGIDDRMGGEIVRASDIEGSAM